MAEKWVLKELKPLPDDHELVPYRPSFGYYARRAWTNLASDFQFCTDAFRTISGVSWWGGIMIAARRMNRLVEIVLGSGIVAVCIAGYVYWIYPHVGKRWTAIFGLSALILGFSVTIRVTRRFYEKTQLLLIDSQKEAAKWKGEFDLLQKIAQTPSPQMLSLPQLEEAYGEYYEIKRLEPHIIALSLSPKSERAHFSSDGIILAGAPEQSRAFTAFVIPFGNQSAHRVARVNRVHAQFTINDFDGNYFQIYRGAWLNQREAELDFPQNCLPRKLIVLGVDEKGAFVIGRDNESEHRSAPTETPLTKNVYEIIISLSSGGQQRKSLTSMRYILEIGTNDQEQSFKFQDAGSWRGFRLHDFWKRGREFTSKLHQRTMDSYERFPVDFVSQATYQREFDLEIVDDVRTWQNETADFLKRFLNEGKTQEFLAGPSLDDGLNRSDRRHRFHIGGKREHSLPYWTLQDVIILRLERLNEFSKQSMG